MPVETFNTYDTRDDLAAALSDQIADRLTLDNASGDFASVALSGGSTPKINVRSVAVQAGCHP